MDAPPGPDRQRTRQRTTDGKRGWAGPPPGGPPRLDSLAAARPGCRYRISKLHFELVRARCEELGCEVGDEVTCLEKGPRGVAVCREDGRRVTVEREYAAFVEVEPAEGPAGGERA